MSDKYSMEILQELEAALYKESDARIKRDNETHEQITELQEKLEGKDSSIMLLRGQLTTLQKKADEGREGYPECN